MSALPLPANPLPVPSNVATQGGSNNNAANTDDKSVSPAFATVLQQKVQSKGASEKAESKNVSSVSGNEASSDAKSTALKDADADTSAAIALVNGEFAEDSLENLLPWLQGLQGVTPQSNDTGPDTQQASSEALLSQPDPATQLNAALIAAQTQQPPPAAPVASSPERKAGGKGANDDLIASTAPPLEASDTASDTAKLAASLSAEAKQTESLTDTSTQSATVNAARFDATLQAAKEQLNTHGSGRNSEPLRMSSPLGSQQWQNELGDRVNLMSRQNDSRAELILTPPQLGRIEISLDIQGDQASALFVSANPEVRAALEGAMDRLREVLAGNGISLSQSHVGAESSNQSAWAEQGKGQSGQGLADAGTENIVPAATAWTRHNNNMLDVFA